MDWKQFSLNEWNVFSLSDYDLFGLDAVGSSGYLQTSILSSHTYESLLSYSLIQTGNVLYVNDTSANGTIVNNNQSLTLYKDFGPNYFDEIFTHTFKLRMTSAKYSPGTCTVWEVANNIYNEDTLWGGYSDACGLQLNSGRLVLQSHENHGQHFSTLYLEQNTDYYIKVSRSYTSLTAYVYDNAAQTGVPLSNMAVSLPANRKYRYFVPINKPVTSTNLTVTLDVSLYDTQKKDIGARLTGKLAMTTNISGVVNVRAFSNILTKLSTNISINPQERTSGWLAGWTKRKKIEIDNRFVLQNFDDFTVPVFFNDIDIASYAKSDGSDIRFTSADGTTLLTFEKDIFSINNGLATTNLWVKNDLDTGSPTTIYMYYGNPSATSVSANPYDAFTSTYYHFGNGSGFDGSSNWNKIPSINATGVFTYTAWIQSMSGYTNLGIAGFGNTNSFLIVDSSGCLTASLLLGGNKVVINSNYVVNDYVWHHVGLVWDIANIKLYADGVVRATVASSGLLNTTLNGTVGKVSRNYPMTFYGDPLMGLGVVNNSLDYIEDGIPTMIDNGEYYFYGNMRECKVHLTARSDNWIYLEANSNAYVTTLSDAQYFAANLAVRKEVGLALFTRAAGIGTYGIPLYVAGMYSTINNSLPLYVFNQYKDKSLRLYIEGLGTSAGSIPYGAGIPLWIGAGGNSQEKGLPLYLYSKIGSQSGSLPLYVNANNGTSINNQMTLVIPKVYDTNSKGLRLFTRGF